MLPGGIFTVPGHPPSPSRAPGLPAGHRRCGACCQTEEGTRSTLVAPPAHRGVGEVRASAVRARRQPDALRGSCP